MESVRFSGNDTRSADCKNSLFLSPSLLFSAPQSMSSLHLSISPSLFPKMYPASTHIHTLPSPVPLCFSLITQASLFQHPPRLPCSDLTWHGTPLLDTITLYSAISKVVDDSFRWHCIRHRDGASDLLVFYLLTAISCAGSAKGGGDSLFLDGKGRNTLGVQTERKVPGGQQGGSKGLGAKIKG